jgi:hypothetical protein
VSRGAVYTTGVACQKDFGSGEQLEERPVFPDGCYTREGVSLGEEVPSPALMRLLERWWRAQSSETEVLNVPVSGDEEKHLQVLGYLDAQ